MKKFLITLSAVLFAILAATAIAALGGFIFMYVWNYVAPVYWAAAPKLSFLQGWATMILISVAFNKLEYKSKK